MTTSSTRVRQQARSRMQVECFVKLFQLRKTKEYIGASETIHALAIRRDKADKLLDKAKSAYIPHLNKRTDLQTKYSLAEKKANKAQGALSDAIERACLKFGLVQWCPPDATVGLEDADCFIEPSRPIVLVEPPMDRRIDLNAEINKEIRRKLERDGVADEPSRRYTMADKEGWLTIRIQTNAPLPELEAALDILLRQNRWHTRKTRNRPDKTKEALETFVCYQETRKFMLVARQLGRRVSTIKGQYVRAHALLHGQGPSGSIKERRAGIIKDPAAEFWAHYGTCSRCQKAESADSFCPKFLAHVNQNTKAALDTRSGDADAVYGNSGRRTPRRATADHTHYPD